MTQQTWTAAEMLKQAGRIDGTALDPKRDYGADCVLAASMLRYAAALRAEIERQRRALDLSLLKKLDELPTDDEKDGEIDRLTAEVERLNGELAGLSTDYGNLLKESNAHESALTAERQKVQELREYHEAVKEGIGANGFGTYWLGVRAGHNEALLKMNQLGLAPAPTTGKTR